MFVVGIIGFFVYNYFSTYIYYYFILAILISILESLDNTFQYSLIPDLVEKNYLYKANSLSAMFSNINGIVSPLLSFVVYNILNLKYMILAYGLINLFASLNLKRVKYVHKKPELKKEKIIKEWYNTFKYIYKEKEIFMCIFIGVIINLIFAPIPSTVLLKIGELNSNEVFGQSLFRTILSFGSFVGIFLVYKLDVKKYYKKYISFSFYVLLIINIFLVLYQNYYYTILLIFSNSIFVMFIMNSTGTYLQSSAKKEELSSIYAVRSTIYVIVVPTSQIISGIILEKFSLNFYFIYTTVLIFLVIILNVTLFHYKKM
ncbi:hypothetical protein OSSY52_12970 [Tepiditoga spiralis]|uniref:MFS transporter n=1 Tax=Tepiditoga spiralis TaxID=2108365 RepID=A0A7G1G741_9BACT|nr:hypothetical protein OSSY52_12970 [Tepiditoga spiralis]